MPTKKGGLVRLGWLRMSEVCDLSDEKTESALHTG